MRPGKMLLPVRWIFGEMSSKRSNPSDTDKKPRENALDGSPGAVVSEDLRLYSRFSKEIGLYVNMVLIDGRVASLSMARQRWLGAETEHPYLARIIDHLATGTDDFRDIPVVLKGSPFDREVLELIRTIPPGEVVTYGEVAARLGRPRAARAVGGACSRNPVPLIIPCHRVVSASGGLGKYSGGDGTRTKELILQKEGALPMPKDAPGVSGDLTSGSYDDNKKETID
jgi:methylated-DNA-[protein]-cysteine S-methyltransferase